ncbi:MAG TPA: lamin tail domain-containing protein, partial [Candidatus Paceibacterota bacterium]|nr:lamin tail domain-containing protein [Candidatus Paceibacterota bacterium]
MKIVEALPNPSGKDTEGEWIKISNDSDKTVLLKGWTLKDASNKKFVFSDVTVQGGGFVILKPSETRISLNNNGDTLYLFDSNGILADTFSYTGSASDDEVFIKSNGATAYSLKKTDNINNISKEEYSIKNTSNSLNNLATVKQFLGNQNFWIPIIGGILVSLVLTAVFWEIFKYLRNDGRNK